MSKHTFGLRYRNVPLLMLQSRERILGHFRPLLTDHGLTEQQWRIIRVLLDISPLEPRQIGELCGILSASMAGILDRMEQQNFIRRQRLVHDQRRVHVTLTARSRRLAEQLAPAINRVYDGIASQVGAKLWQRVQESLDELIAALPVSSGTSTAESVGGAVRHNRA